MYNTYIKVKLDKQAVEKIIKKYKVKTLEEYVNLKLNQDLLTALG